jgi:hypothetical protein
VFQRRLKNCGMLTTINRNVLLVVKDQRLAEDFTGLGTLCILQKLNVASNIYGGKRIAIKLFRLVVVLKCLQLSL